MSTGPKWIRKCPGGAFPRRCLSCDPKHPGRVSVRHGPTWRRHLTRIGASTPGLRLALLLRAERMTARNIKCQTSSRRSRGSGCCSSSTGYSLRPQRLIPYAFTHQSRRARPRRLDKGRGSKTKLFLDRPAMADHHRTSAITSALPPVMEPSLVLDLAFMAGRKRRRGHERSGAWQMVNADQGS